MAAHPEPALDDHLWTIAAARILLGPRWHVQAPPNLAFDDFPRLLDAGIDDWGGVSPVTIDHVNPEAPWPEIERLAEATRSRGLELAPRLPVYPEYVARALARSGGHAVRAPRGGRDLARPRRLVGARRPGHAAVRRASRRPAARARRRRARRGRDHAAARSTRERRCSASSRPPTVSAATSAGTTVTYVVTRNIQYTNVCYFRCGFCAFSKGKLAANLRGAPYLVPRDEIVRRVRGGVGARRDRGLPPGRDPSRVHGRLLRGRRPRDTRRRARDPRARVLGARGVAGRCDTRPLPRGVPRASPRPRPRVASGNRRRGARRRGAAGHLPRQGDDGAVARGARRCAPRRPALERDAHVRPRRVAAQLGTAPPARAGAAAALGRFHGVRAAPVRTDGGADLPTGPRAPGPDLPRRRSSCTRSRGSRFTRRSRTSRRRG